MDSGMHTLKIWMMISTGLYVIGGLSFLLGQNILLENLNKTSERLFGDRFPRIPLSTEKFWLVLTNSMMLMLVVICAMVSIDPEKYHSMVIILLFSKAFSSLQYLLLFLVDKRYFAYLTGFLTDGPLFVITLIIYLGAV